MASNGGTSLEVARSSWGQAAPEWVIVMAEMCDRSNQAKVAKRLGVSATVVNQALHDKYAGRLDKLEQRVRGEFMREMVACPVLGEITRRRCLDEQNRPYAATNAVRVELRRACRRCSHCLNKDD